ncbi:hypothetical protein PFISCL1PPCAC_14200, partial [Pristionchus fissidentatus]
IPVQSNHSEADACECDAENEKPEIFPFQQRNVVVLEEAAHLIPGIIALVVFQLLTRVRLREWVLSNRNLGERRHFLVHYVIVVVLIVDCIPSQTPTQV